MKIVCESCGAKYSIADEKVAGKVFKIRCKRCSDVIVVRGDQQPDATEEQTRVFDYGADAVWHVVVDGEQTGPMSPVQIGDLLADGRIDWEAYVWREGMDGWQPAKDVQELVSAVMAESEGAGDTEAGQAAAEPAEQPSAESPYGSGEIFGGSADMGADPFADAGDDGGLSSLVDEQPAAASAAGGGADLFAGAADTGAANAFAGVDDDEPAAPAASASPRVEAGDAMTGQRNENSVLFSLSNLQALATGSGSGGGAPSGGEPGKPGMASGEGSGLIDIRALAQASAAVGESEPNGSSKESVEELLSVGAAGTSFSAANLAAPVAPETSEGSSKLLVGVGMGIGVAAVLGLVGVFALRGGDDAEQVADAPQAAAAAAAAAPVAPSNAAPPAPAPTPATAAQPSAPAKAEEPAEEEPAAAAAADNDGTPKRRSPPKRRNGRVAAAKSRRPSPAPSATPTPAPPKKRRQSSGDESLDSLLASALDGTPPPRTRKKPTPSAGSSLPATPSRADVKKALQRISGAVKACAKGQTGVAMTKITVSGATGRVTNAQVSGSFGGSPVGSCVSRTVRSKARFPKFSKPTMSITYPFKL